ncbi:F-box/kelch-repeat protein At3g06240 [Linum grandiflorum]
MHNLYTYNYTIVLWNPSIGKTFNLPLPGLTFDTHGAFEALLGFGFDSATQDYKVVRILRLLERDDLEIEVEVFSLKSRSWKRIVSPRAPQYSIVERGSQAFVNGSVHWVATIRNEGNGRDKNLIVGFQLGDERFRELQLPESLEMESPIFLTVSPYMDSTIAVFRRNYLTRSDTEIWVMSEYGSVDSWVRLLTVGMYENGVPRALGFRSNGDVLFELSGGEIVSGDPESFEVRELELQGEVGYSVVCSFEETLVLLDK